jgi:hypothetical protein
MERWMAIWQAVLILGLALFAALSVWIAVAGWSDVRALFRVMRGGRRKSNRS